METLADRLTRRARKIPQMDAKIVSDVFRDRGKCSKRHRISPIVLRQYIELAIQH